MFTRVTQLAIVLVAIVMFVVFDSGSSLMGQTNNGPGESGWEQSVGNSVTGIFGMYELVVNTSDETIGLQSNEILSEDKGCTVGGFSFYTMGPCDNCFTLPEEAISFLADTIELNFHVKHPVEMGDDGAPPTVLNRKDLDIFDLALVIAPRGYPEKEFPLAKVSVCDGTVLNADGFTRDMQNVTGKPTVLPYVLVVDDESGVTDSHNRFAMGSEEEVEVILSKYEDEDDDQTYDLYLVAGLGVSVENENYLTPKYYNPEFNRKAAWKVRVSPPGYNGPRPDALSMWNEDSPYTEHLVAVEVFDWQIDAKVYDGADFADAEQDEVYASSDIFSVSIEIPGMNSILPTVSGCYAGGKGTPDDPRVFLVPVANENNLPAGNYTGLAIVSDMRDPADSSAENRDILIERIDDEVTKKEIPGYTTYMSFSVNILEPTVPSCNNINGSIISIAVNSSVFPPPPRPVIIHDGDTVIFDVMAISAGGSGEIGRIEADYDYILPFRPDESKPPDSNMNGKYFCTFTRQFNLNDPAITPSQSILVAFQAADTCSPVTETVFARIALTIVANPPPTP